ncbi:hypothetical protein NDU88_003338 [Pleurodeles waltl]|uniref:Uncharacterized protein n=1 Tax=Pleurodeles waltl TaxID=8319 RepID=A0AAV7P9M4_PLEWA|nr:hypothetical protein NDU88_003338 [Pleurodeles waltl]
MEGPRGHSSSAGRHRRGFSGHPPPGLGRGSPGVTPALKFGSFWSWDLRVQCLVQASGPLLQAVADHEGPSPHWRVQTSPLNPQKMPTVTIAALPYWSLMTSPDHRGPRDSRFPLHRHSPTLTFHPLVTPVQHPPSGPKPPYPGQVNQLCVHHYREPRITHHPNNNRDLGAVAVGTQSRGRRHRNTGELGGLLCDGADRPREPTLHEALSSIMGAYHHSQESMATVLVKFQETQRLQEEQYLGFREELRTISSALGTIVGVLKDI